MKLVEQHGCIYKMSNAVYKRLLRLIVVGQDCDLQTLGAKVIGPISPNPTTMTSGQALEALTTLKLEKEE